MNFRGKPLWIAFFGACIPWYLCAVLKADEQARFFESDVRPILKSHCFQCHGEESELQAGLDLRLVRLMVRGGESGPAGVPGDTSSSLLWNRISLGEMPPKGKGLSDHEKAVVRQWIEQGMRTKRPEPDAIEASSQWTEEERTYWAFQRPIRPEVPAVSSSEQVRTAIDSFLLSKLESNGLSFSDDADRSTLARRLSFDLLGLPPEPQWLGEFLRDNAPEAYERLVDRMLASPAYGERWGRHWLDAAGYADSDGYSDKDEVRPWAYRYRDYIIRSLNESKRLDEWIIEQLAGDELVPQPYDNLGQDQVDKLIATGYLRMAPDGTESGSDSNVSRNDLVAETIKIVSTSLLGLTVGCAQCHNHRYDPISQVDYYRFRAVFEPALDWKKWRSKQERLVDIRDAIDRQQAAAVDARMKRFDERQKAELDCIVQEIFDRELTRLPEETRHKAIAARSTKRDERTSEQKQLMKDYPSLNVDRGSAYLYEPDRLTKFNKYWEEIRTKVRSDRPADQFVACLSEVPGHIPATHVFFRGDWNQPREQIRPGIPSIFSDQLDIADDDPYVPTSGRRLALARHLTDGRHPLVSRVLVNRVWMHHFGKGIVNSAGDFGVLGERPSHPELLDWLAVELVSGQWDLKRLQRLIVCSTAYRQQSQRSETQDAVDPDNRLLGRMNVRRLETEAIRDAMLDVSGLRTRTMYGPPSPVNPDDVGQIIVGSANRDGNGIMIAQLVDDPQQYRRSIYVQVRRSMPLGILEPFDIASSAPNCDRRSFSTVSTQSLLLMNNQFAIQYAERFAERILRDCGDDLTAVIQRAFGLAFGRKATDKELEESTQLILRLREEFETRAQRNEQDKSKIPIDDKSKKKGKSGDQTTEKAVELPPQVQSLALFCQALMSSNRFLYVD